ncbi:hypothetical protein BD626DRAFT_423313 [Schizophyllum amplum]|uniref:LysM domain-containing protein n=1 Tax=Schizophyllum amplum TaxID=97359 RepID=A0A550D0A1_9AGAR|nr:hypothetical protein BD626DRAFT_423313 [Auriculariopsis ampla]
MARWSQYHEDSHRLPEGMTRIGYDADTQRYQFRDSDGSVWQGPEGAEYGEMTRGEYTELVQNRTHNGVTVSDGGQESSPAEDADVEQGPPSRSDGYSRLATDLDEPVLRGRGVDTSAYRSLFPFFLIIAVVLLVVWKFILSPNIHETPSCPPDQKEYTVEPGDSCYQISIAHGIPLDKFFELNPKVKCDLLLPGSSVCLPRARAVPAPTSSSA